MIPVEQQQELARRPGFRPEDPGYLVSGVMGWRLTVRPHVWRPPTDIYETEDDFVVRVEIAGMSEAEFSVTVDQNTLAIRGVRSDTPARRAFHQMEIHFGEFSIEVEFPSTVDVNGVEAEYQDGFLRVILPKQAPKKITLGG